MAKNKFQLTPRELDIMNLLWKSEKPLKALDIANISGEIPINTVQATLKKLLQKKYISVAGVVYSGNVLSRSYIPVISATDYEVQRVFHTMKDSSLYNFTASGFVAAFLNQETNTEVALKNLEELEKFVQEKRRELMQNEDSVC